jgi:hypothetical protein
VLGKVTIGLDFLRTLGFSPVITNLHLVLSHLHLNTNLIRRRGGRILETFEEMLFQVSGRTGQKNTFSLCFRYSKCNENLYKTSEHLIVNIYLFSIIYLQNLLTSI